MKDDLTLEQLQANQQRGSDEYWAAYLALKRLRVEIVRPFALILRGLSR